MGNYTSKRDKAMEYFAESLDPVDACEKAGLQVTKEFYLRLRDRQSPESWQVQETLADYAIAVRYWTDDVGKAILIGIAKDTKQSPNARIRAVQALREFNHEKRLPRAAIEPLLDHFIASYTEEGANDGN